MKTIKFLIPLLCAIILSCGVQNNVNNGRWLQKRKYTKGWQIKRKGSLASKGGRSNDSTLTNAHAWDYRQNWKHGIPLIMEESSPVLTNPEEKKVMSSVESAPVTHRNEKTKIPQLIPNPYKIKELIKEKRLTSVSTAKSQEPDKEKFNKALTLTIVFLVIGILMLIWLNSDIIGWLGALVAGALILLSIIMVIVFGIRAIIYGPEKTPKEKADRKANRGWLFYFFWALAGATLFGLSLLYYAIPPSPSIIPSLFGLAGLVIAVIFTIITIVVAVKRKKAKTLDPAG